MRCGGLCDPTSGRRICCCSCRSRSRRRRLADTGSGSSLLAAFACWSAVASAGYLANDCARRRRRSRRSREARPPVRERRPAGRGSASRAGIALALRRPRARGGGRAAGVRRPLVVYLVLTLAYSLYVKRLLLLDVLLLAGLYTLRLLAGGAAIGIALTPWLLAFSLFFFLGLAFAKRYGELAADRRASARRPVEPRLPQRRSRSRDDARRDERLSVGARAVPVHQQRSRGPAVPARRARSGSWRRSCSTG